MIVNCFKESLFEDLKQYNHEIVEVCDRHTINKYGLGNTDGHSCWWYDPRGQNKLHLTASYRKHGQIVFPETEQFVYEPRFCLVMYAPNYPALFICNKLYGDKKDVLIEDLGCGLSQITFYLSKLGFTNFSLVENYKFLTEALAKDFWNTGIKKYKLNEPNTQPIVSVIVGHHPMPKEYTPSTELYCVYEKDTLIADFEKLDGYKFLCRDSDGMINFYARNDKYDEFKAKLEPYKVD
jgi:hypothetical protein